MAGKPTIPPEVHAKIRTLFQAHRSYSQIKADIGCSTYTVRKALDPDFPEQERERQKKLWPERAIKRAKDPNYAAFQAAYCDTDEYRARVRARMADLRKRRREEKEHGPET